MFDRNTILALVLVGAILLLMMTPQYQRLISRKGPPQPQTTEQTQTATPSDTTAKAAAPATALTTPPPTPPAGGGEPVVAGVIYPDTAAVQSDYVDVETPLFSLQIGSNAQPSNYILKKYKRANGDPVDLHHQPTGTTPSVGVVDFNFASSNPKTIKNLRFTASKRTLKLENGIDSIAFVVGEADGQQIEIVYVISADKYGFDIALHTQKLAVPETGEYKALWMGGVPTTEPDPSRDIQYSGAYALVGDDLEKITVGNNPRKDFNATGSTYFVAARSKYFMAAMVPKTPAAGTDIAGFNEAPRVKGAPVLYDLGLRETWGASAGGRWTIYWGPIKYDYLKAVGVGLEGTMNWGWAIIKPISRVVLIALTYVHTVIPNYGFVIIIFSIVIKVILWPLTRKSQISMKKMQALQPEITAIRELHAKNAQAMNAAIMALYKERGVNPASGCLPLLLQMPVLYSLFIIFSTTIEFRQAPFMLWIKDLSQPDIIAHLGFSIPLYGATVAILPLVMGLTQFIMSKRTTTDPNQKMMVYIMPIFMTLIFNNFPSGLTLYYTLFNLWAIVEQNLIKVPDFTPSVQVVEDKKKKR
jgi:YidC/Oxa1 family membrane protein insertase